MPAASINVRKDGAWKAATSAAGFVRSGGVWVPLASGGAANTPAFVTGVWNCGFDPVSIAYGPAGRLWYLARYSNALYSINPTTEFVGRAEPLAPSTLTGLVALGNYLYACRGDSQATYRFNPTTRTWDLTLPAAYGFPVGGQYGFGVFGGRLHYMGGQSGAETYHQSMAPGDSVWTAHARMPASFITQNDCFSCHMASYQGRLWACGAWGSYSSVNSDVKSWDPVGDTWRAETGVPTADGGGWSGIFTLGGALHFIGPSVTKRLNAGGTAWDLVSNSGHGIANQARGAAPDGTGMAFATINGLLAKCGMTP